MVKHEQGIRLRLLVSVAVAGIVVGFAAKPALADGVYASVFGGTNTVDAMRLSSNQSPYSDYPRILNFNSGSAFGGAVGHQFGPFRGEAELSWRFNGLKSITVQGEGSGGGTGNVNVFAMMANGWFDIAGPMGFTPYIGAGVGLASVHVAAQTSKSPSQGLDFAQSRWTTAFQLGGGLAIGVGGGAKLSLDYRFFTTGSFNIEDLRGDGYGTADATYRAHSLMVGFTMPLGLRLPFP